MAQQEWSQAQKHVVAFRNISSRECRRAAPLEPRAQKVQARPVDRAALEATLLCLPGSSEFADEWRALGLLLPHAWVGSPGWLQLYCLCSREASDLDLGTGLTSGGGKLHICGGGWSLVAEDPETLTSGCLRPFVVSAAPVAVGRGNLWERLQRRL